MKNQSKNHNTRLFLTLVTTLAATDRAGLRRTNLSTDTKPANVK